VSLSLRESLALASFLSKHIEDFRKKDLGAQAAREMTPGERLAVKFGGRLAAWVSMPQPAVRASVKDKAAFLAWAEKKLPGEVETVRQVREATQRQLMDAAKAGGWINPETGEREPIPGVEVSEGDPAPRVELDDQAAEAIGTAWRAGDIDLSGLLAIGPAQAATETTPNGDPE
jgi:hypothetical protein